MGYSTMPDQVSGGFRHEAVFYRGPDAMAGSVLPFIREGIARGEPVLVAVPPDRIAALEAELGPDAARISLVDMFEVGRNPACIIPVWQEFLDGHDGEVSVRGVGEPVWAGRRDVEIEECRFHEALLNVAFDRGPSWRLVCPYDADALPDAVISDAMRTHPVSGPRPFAAAAAYQGHAHAFGEFSTPLPDPPDIAEEVRFTLDDLAGLRSVVRHICASARLDPDAADDMVLAAHELATNSVTHGGGGGLLRGWRQDDALVLEISDDGVIDNPLVGREPSLGLEENGRGVWIANQLCDLVQVRSSGGGTAVRLYSWL